MRRGFLLAAVLFGACVATQEAGRKLSPDQFEDIPAPKTSTYQHSSARSFAYRSKSFRCGKFVYTDPGPAATVVDFYTSVMTQPPYSWKLEQEETGKLTFSKSVDRCTVDIKAGPTVSILVRVNYLR